MNDDSHDIKQNNQFILAFPFILKTLSKTRPQIKNFMIIKIFAFLTILKDYI